MSQRTRAGALTVLAVTGLTLGAVLAEPAAAATSRPGFLSAADLPPHPTSSWTAGKVTAGEPEDLEWDTCLRALPGHENVWYRDFRTDLETNARQITVVLPDTGSAKSLVSALNKDITSCPVRIEGADPEIEATSRDYGTLPVEEGAHVHGLHTETSWGATDISLLSVGRDGRTVTVVDWGQMGDFDDAPVKAFKKTTTAAVNKLH
ncbi:Sensor domain-containing protein OS=Streptomyces alboniger OX=132473 GN=CP975_01290 PE=4 SV=1 [Streptomyces alboniger]